MRPSIYQRITLSILLGTLLMFPTFVSAATEAEDLPQGHSKFTTVVTKKAAHQLNENMARRHGQEPFKAGEKVVVVLDENNYIVDMHRKGQEGTHRQVTGKLIHVGMTRQEIKLQTPDGEQGQKTKGIPDGALVTVELKKQAR